MAIPVELMRIPSAVNGAYDTLKKTDLNQTIIPTKFRQLIINSYFFKCAKEPGENGLFQEAHKSGSCGQAEDHESAEDVQWHVGRAERMADARKQESDESKEPLQCETDDGC